MLAFLEGPELIIVLVIILVIFGGSQLPRLARNLGQAKKEFEKGISEEGQKGKSQSSDRPQSDS